MEYRLFSWNINGIRASLDQVTAFLKDYKPTVLSLQETKAERTQIPDEFFGIDKMGDFFGSSGNGENDFRIKDLYNSHWVHSVARKGYSGVANFYDRQLDPQNIKSSSEDYEFDHEGRILSMEFEHFVLFNVYFPNGGRGDKFVKSKIEFYDRLLSESKNIMDNGKEIIICGDVNTARHPIDLARPKQNVKTSGFLPEEREALERYFEAGFIDTYRHFYPDKEGAYTWWSARAVTAKENNVGWRIDYYLITPGLLPYLKAAEIHQDITGSDHCPISIILAF